jgi:AbrB family transcriptional regulator, transcriptional pleiotropic regulator of transition state genes
MALLVKKNKLLNMGDTNNMKSTGIVRKVDELGRVVIPVELRKVLAIKEKDPIEIFVNGEQLILKKYFPYNECIITGDITPQNREYAKGLVLSPRGAEILKNEIEFKFNIKA